MTMSETVSLKPGRNTALWAKFIQVQQLIDFGLSVTAACARVGLARPTFYKYLAKQKAPNPDRSGADLSTPEGAATSAEQFTPSALGGEDRDRRGA